MAGHRDDGTVADDKRHHPNRKIVDLAAYRQQKAWEARRDHPSVGGHEDDAPPHGIPRPKLTKEDEES